MGGCSLSPSVRRRQTNTQLFVRRDPSNLYKRRSPLVFNIRLPANHGTDEALARVPKQFESVGLGPR